MNQWTWLYFCKKTKSKIYRCGFGCFLKTCVNCQHDQQLELLADQDDILAGVDRPLFWALYMWLKNKPVALVMDFSILLWTPISSSLGSTLSGPRIIFSQNFKLNFSVVTNKYNFSLPCFIFQEISCILLLGPSTGCLVHDL